MGLLDKLRKASSGGAAKGHRQTCRYIWQHYVPASGPSSVLQGELLREVEDLRYEAMNNGNINWDDYRAAECDFIERELCDKGRLPEDRAQAVRAAVARIRACGEYSVGFHADAIPVEELDVDMIACVEDGPYDTIEEAIALIHSQAGGPLPFSEGEAGAEELLARREGAE